MTPDTEKGFGTGLRAQLLRRREIEADEPGPHAKPHPAAGPGEDQPVPAGTGGELDQLRAELRASLGREQELRVALSQQVEAYERELDADRNVSRRLLEIEQQASRLAVTEATLVGRERALLASPDLQASGYTDNANLAKYLESFLQILMDQTPPK